MKKSVELINLPTVNDSRGSLTSVEQLKDIPFDIKRIFYMHHIVNDRGGHAHIDTDQIIIPISGSFKVKTFDGVTEQEYWMNNSTIGLYTPRLTYCDLYDFSPEAVCLVLSNTHYDMKNSLRTLSDYVEYLKHNK